MKLFILLDEREYYFENKYGGVYGEEFVNLMIKVWFIVVVF